MLGELPNDGCFLASLGSIFFTTRFGILFIFRARPLSASSEDAFGLDPTAGSRFIVLPPFGRLITDSVVDDGNGRCNLPKGDTNLTPLLLLPLLLPLPLIFSAPGFLRCGILPSNFL